MRLISMTRLAPPLTSPSLPTAEQLPDDVATLKSMLLEVLATLLQERQELERVRHRLNGLLQRLFGPRTERFHPDQLLLFVELAAAPDAPQDTQQETPETAADTHGEKPEKKRRRHKPHGRRRLPENLPHEPCHHRLTEVERLCVCGQTRGEIGVERSEQLEYRPASLLVIEHIVHKYACAACCRARAEEPMEPLKPNTESESATPTSAESLPQAPSAPTVIAAPGPTLPFAKGLPGPGLLAHLIVSKYVDHLPLYRLERIYERQGVFLPRSTTCDWLATCARLLQPLYDLMVAQVLLSRVVHTDDTPVKMQNQAPGALTTTRLWIYWGDTAHPYSVFDFTLNHKRDGPQRFLASYQGYLQADAFTGYDCLYVPASGDGKARILEVACHAHARRKFHEARKSDAVRAHHALGVYRMLFALEGSAQALTDEGRRRMRQEIALPILEQFHAWLQAEQLQVLPKSPMREAIQYALNNWTALLRYTEAGFLAIDNNVAEREMKRIAIGRKNWLFLGSEQGGKTAAILFSFASTCQRLGMEPWAYLQDVLTRLPTTPTERLPELLPDHWGVARTTAASASPPTDSSVGEPG